MGAFPVWRGASKRSASVPDWTTLLRTPTVRCMNSARHCTCHHHMDYAHTRRCCWLTASPYGVAFVGVTTKRGGVRMPMGAVQPALPSFACLPAFPFALSRQGQHLYHLPCHAITIMPACLPGFHRLFVPAPTLLVLTFLVHVIVPALCVVVPHALPAPTVSHFLPPSPRLLPFPTSPIPPPSIKHLFGRQEEGRMVTQTGGHFG